MSKLPLIRLLDVGIYQCEGEGCRAIFALEEGKTEEPICPACGCRYFSFVAIQTLEY